MLRALSRRIRDQLVTAVQEKIVASVRRHRVAVEHLGAARSWGGALLTLRYQPLRAPVYADGHPCGLITRTIGGDTHRSDSPASLLTYRVRRAATVLRWFHVGSEGSSPVETNL